MTDAEKTGPVKRWGVLADCVGWLMVPIAFAQEKREPHPCNLGKVSANAQVPLQLFGMMRHKFSIKE